MLDLANGLTPENADLLMALHGGLKGRFARGFGILQGGIDALGRYLAQNAAPAVQGEAAAILVQMQQQLVRLERLAENTTDLALRSIRNAPEEGGLLELGAYLEGLCQATNEELARFGTARVALETEGELYLIGNEAVMDTLFANLFSNSVQAKRDAAITLHCAADGQLVYRDDGPGITAQDRALLLGQIESPLQLHAGGTGLLLVAACAADLGWTLAVEQDGPLALRIGLGAMQTPTPSALHCADTEYLARSRAGYLRREFEATLSPD